jgi:hypothetical protein
MLQKLQIILNFVLFLRDCDDGTIAKKLPCQRVTSLRAGINLAAT